MKIKFEKTQIPFLRHLLGETLYKILIKFHETFITCDSRNDISTGFQVAHKLEKSHT